MRLKIICVWDESVPSDSGASSLLVYSEFFIPPFECVLVFLPKSQHRSELCLKSESRGKIVVQGAVILNDLTSTTA